MTNPHRITYRGFQIDPVRDIADGIGNWRPCPLGEAQAFLVYANPDDWDSIEGPMPETIEAARAAVDAHPRAQSKMTNLADQILASTGIDDLDSALSPLMDILGVEDGGGAAMAFSAYDGCEFSLDPAPSVLFCCNESLWPTLTRSDRAEVLRRYVKQELNGFGPEESWSA